MRLSSPAFSSGASVPPQYTSRGANVNPPLRLEELPKETKSVTLFVEAPENRNELKTHWVVYDIPPTSQISENSVPGKQAVNDFECHRYVGPSPNGKDLHCRIRAFALDSRLELGGGKGRRDVEKAMEGKVIDSAELMIVCPSMDHCEN